MCVMKEEVVSQETMSAVKFDTVAEHYDLLKYISLKNNNIHRQRSCLNNVGRSCLDNRSDDYSLQDNLRT